MEFDLVPMWISPFIRISNSTPRASKLAERISRFKPLPIIAQIMGTYREHLAGTAGLLSGIDGVIGVELNCACSSNTVIASGTGSALLKKPGWIRDALIAMRDASKGRGGIGVKIRSGFESPDELPAILEDIVEAEPDWITLHYRTGKEFFSKVPEGRKRFMSARRMLMGRILFASGDIFEPNDAVELVDKCGADGITPARGLMRNPWLIRDIEAICTRGGMHRHDVLGFMRRLLEIVAENPKWRNGLLLELAKNIWGRDSEKFLALAKEQTSEGMRRVLDVELSVTDKKIHALSPGRRTLHQDGRYGIKM